MLYHDRLPSLWHIRWKGKSRHPLGKSARHETTDYLPHLQLVDRYDALQARKMEDQSRDEGRDTTMITSGMVAVHHNGKLARVISPPTEYDERVGVAFWLDESTVMQMA